jgi:hypothetical protein
MNRFGSHPNHENRPVYKGPQFQGLSVALASGSIFLIVAVPPRGRPVGGGGIHRTRRKEGYQSQYHI